MTLEQKINTCIWVPRFWPAMGGTELHTHALAKCLSPEFAVNVITHCNSSERQGISIEQDVGNASDGTFAEGDIQINRVALGDRATSTCRYIANKHKQCRIVRPLYSGLFHRSLKQRCNELTKEARLIHYIYNGLTDSAILAATIATQKKIPFVLTPNILDTSERPSAWNSIKFKHLYSRASTIIALTQHESDWLQNLGVCKQKIVVIPYGPILSASKKTDRFRRQLNCGQNRVVLFLGRIVDLKGYDLLLNACNSLWRSNPDVHILFMGPATSEARESILSFGDSRVSLWEEFDQEMKSEALAECDLLCVPSRKESLGVVYIEAAFNAKPVVALDLPVLREVIEHGKDGFLTADSPEHVADALKILLDNPEKAKEMGLYAQSKAFKRFNWADVSKSVGNVYRKLIDMPVEYPTLK